MNIPAARRLKSVDEHLRVHAWTPDGFVHAGTLQLDEQGDREMHAFFSYTREYLTHPQAYPLDPLHLPLGPAQWTTDAPHVQLGAIFDAAPDAWGRRVVRASLEKQEEMRQVYRHAFLRGADGIGALVLTPDEVPDMDAIVAWSLSERPALSQVEAAATAARELEDGGELDERARHMLAGSWTIGGARPKAILRDDRPGAPPNASVIAKFESRTGEGDARNRLEWATLEMAHNMGMSVPRHWLHEMGGRAALLLERFDRSFEPGRALRRHYISAASFVSAVPLDKHLDHPSDVARFSWRNLLAITGRVCAHRGTAQVEMFARLALNAAIGNTDDHLKNFGFLKLTDSAAQYEIAPVFDVSPQGSASHYLNLEGFGRHYTLANAIEARKSLKIADRAAAEVRERILGVLERRWAYYERAGMTEEQAQTADRMVLRGCPELAHNETPEPHDTADEARAPVPTC